MKTRELTKLVDFIAEEPRRLNMHHWIVNVANMSDRLARNFVIEKPPCGMAGCLGGELLMMHGMTLAQVMQENREGGYRSFFERASEIAGLTLPQAKRLFYLSSWPDRNHDEYHKAITPSDRVIATQNRLRYFLKTNGTDLVKKVNKKGTGKAKVKRKLK